MYGNEIARPTLMRKIVYGLADVSTKTLCVSGRQTYQTNYLSFRHLLI